MNVESVVVMIASGVRRFDDNTKSTHQNRMHMLGGYVLLLLLPYRRRSPRFTTALGLGFAAFNPSAGLAVSCLSLLPSGGRGAFTNSARWGDPGCDGVRTGGTAGGAGRSASARLDTPRNGAGGI